MTLVAVVVVMGLLGAALLRARTFRAGCFVYAAVWGLLLGATRVGSVARDALDQLGTWVWQAVQQL